MQVVPGEIEVLLRQAKALEERIDSGAAPAAGAGDEEAEGLADWRRDGRPASRQESEA